MTLSPEDLAKRANRIGGSECAVAAGLGRPKAGEPGQVVTLLELWSNKKGLTPFEGNAWTEWGHQMEPAIAAAYAASRKVSLYSTPSLVSPKTDWMLATPDRIVVDRGGKDPGDIGRYYFNAPGQKWNASNAVHALGVPARLLQIKNVGEYLADEWGEPGTDEVPAHVIAQVHWEMAVFNDILSVGDPVSHRVTVCDIAASIGGQPPVYYTIEWDQEFFDLIFEANRRFVTDHLLPNVEPPLDFASPFASKYLAAKYGGECTGEILDASPVVAEIVAEYALAKETAGNIGKRIKTMETQLQSIIGEAIGIDAAAGRVTWKPQKGKVGWKEVAGALHSRLVSIASVTSLDPVEAIETIGESHRGKPFRKMHIKRRGSDGSWLKRGKDEKEEDDA